MLAGFAAKAGCVISTVSEVQAPAENGTNMRSQQACLDCSYSIQGQEFSTDFTLLEVPRIWCNPLVLIGFTLIVLLGLNLKAREFSITKYGIYVVTFSDETLPLYQVFPYFILASSIWDLCCHIRWCSCHSRVDVPAISFTLKLQWISDISELPNCQFQLHVYIMNNVLWRILPLNSTCPRTCGIGLPGKQSYTVQSTYACMPTRVMSVFLTLSFHSLGHYIYRCSYI